MKHWKRWLLIAFAVVAVGAVTGPYIYIHFIEGKAPPPLSLSTSLSPEPSTTGPALSVAGDWAISGDSVVGYRVHETLNGQSNTAAGRTSGVQGSLSVAGTSVTKAEFTVDLTSVTSNEPTGRRDRQFRGRIMDTGQFPNGTFKLTSPMSLGAVPAVGTPQTFHATGDLTLHGVTKSMRFDLSARRNKQSIDVSGSIPITFADFSIPNPSFGSFVTTDDHGVLEFLLHFTKA